MSTTRHTTRHTTTTTTTTEAAPPTRRRPATEAQRLAVAPAFARRWKATTATHPVGPRGRATPGSLGPGYLRRCKAAATRWTAEDDAIRRGLLDALSPGASAALEVGQLTTRPRNGPPGYDPDGTTARLWRSWDRAVRRGKARRSARRTAG